MVRIVTAAGTALRIVWLIAHSTSLSQMPAVILCMTAVICTENSCFYTLYLYNPL